MRNARAQHPRPASTPASTCGPPAATPGAPRLRARLQVEAVCLLGYIVLALWWTWPLALGWGTRIGGGHGPLSIGDNLQFAWNFDHTARAWAQGQSAFVDSGLFFPHRASLALHTMQWHHCALAALAWKILPGLALASVCNSLLIGTLCLNGWATRALCRHVLERLADAPLPLAAIKREHLSREFVPWLIGAAAAFGPFSQARSFGHWNLLAWGYLPLLMLALLRLDQVLASQEPWRVCLRRALAAGLCLALAGWCDVQFALFAGLWAIAFSIFSPHPHRLGRAAWWCGSLGFGAVLLGPLVLTMLGASRGAAKMAIAPQWSLDVADLFSPSPWHPILGRFSFAQVRTDGIEWVVAPGLALLLLGAWGWRCFPRVARPWAWSAIALWLLACGPRAQIAHRPIPALPFASASARAQGAPASREAAWEEAVRLPFWWLRESVGPLKSFRVPARISIVALACWSACAALGLNAALGTARRSQSPGNEFPPPGEHPDGLWPSVPQTDSAASTCSEPNESLPAASFGRPAKGPSAEEFIPRNLIPTHLNARSLPARPRLWMLAIAVLLILCDICRAPLPSFDARTPRWAEIIRDAGGTAQGVVPLPLAFNDWRLSWAMWGQTIHRKPLFNAYLSRAPRDLPPDAMTASALWFGLSAQAQSDHPSERLALANPLPSPAQAARDLEIWARRGARFLLWQRGGGQPQDEARVRSLFKQSQSARLVSEDASALLWEIVPARGAGGTL